MILDKSEWRVVEKPRELLKIISGRFGIQPDASIEYLPNGRKLYFEVKKQEDSGNAEERACKHHTAQFQKEIHELFGYSYHPFTFIACDKLATLERYTVKYPFYFEPDHYFCWVDYDLDALADYIARIADRWLIH